MKKIHSFYISLFCIFFCNISVFGKVIVEQNSNNGSIASHTSIGQSFYIAKDTNITSIEIISDVSQSCDLKIYGGDGFSGSVLYTQAVNLIQSNSSFQTFTLDNPLFIASNNMYTFEFNCNGFFQLKYKSDNPYIYGNAYNNQSSQTNDDLSFRINGISNNNIPIISSSAMKSASENSKYSYVLKAYDMDGDDLNWSIKSAPSWLSLYNANKVTTFAESIDSPEDLAIDDLGNVYVSEKYHIKKIDKNGNPTILAGGEEHGYQDGNSTISRFIHPSGLDIDSEGNIYVADLLDHRIRKVDKNGNVTTLAGSGGEGYQDGNSTTSQFKRPIALAVDSEGNIYVADSENHRIRKVDKNGNVTTLAGSGTAGYKDGNSTDAEFNSPRSIALGSDGNIYVSDKLNHRIRKIDKNGNVTTYAGSGNPSHYDFTALGSHFNFPSGLAIDNSENVYVSDTKNHQIRKINKKNHVTTLVGIREAGFIDSNLSDSKFNRPEDVKIDFDGNIYVADTRNNSIRKIDIATTLVGTPNSSDVGDHNITLTVTDGDDIVEQNFILTVARLNKPPEFNTSSLEVIKTGYKRDDVKKIVYDFDNNISWIDDNSSETKGVLPDSALSYCSSISYNGYSDWRIPSINELNSTIDTNNSPMMNFIFQNVSNSGYWSSTVETGLYWFVHFAIGFQGKDITTYQNGRCVRDGLDGITYEYKKSIIEKDSFVIDINASDTENSDSLTYSISSVDSLYFDINSTTGVIRFKNTSDFESPKDSNKDNIYELIVKAIDVNGSESNITLHVEVKDIEINSKDFNISMDEDTSYTFSSDDFNYTSSDSNYSFESIFITSLPNKGNLLLSDTNISLNQKINKSDISNIVYKPLSNEYGNSYTSFTFKVASQDENSSLYTATINVNPLDDIPTITSTSIISIDEDSAYSYELNASDVDGDILTWSLSDGSSLPNWLTIQSSNYSIESTNITQTFSNPSDIFIDGSDTIFILNTGDSSVKKIGLDGSLTTVAQNLISPFAMYVYSNGDIYVANKGNHSITKTSSGSNTQVDHGLSSPSGVVFDGTSVYFSDTGNDRIVRLNEVETYKSLENPTQMTINIQKTVYTIDPVANKIYKIENGSAAKTDLILDDTLNSPSDITIDNEGNLYVSDKGNNRIIKISNEQNVTTLIKDISNVQSLAIDSNKNIYVIDNNTSNVVKYKYDLSKKYKIVGTPTNANVGVHDINLTLSDGQNNINHNFKITVSNTNDSPIIQNELISINRDINLSSNIRSLDVNNDDLFGNSIAIDGDYAIIAAYLEDENLTGGDSKYNAGSAYIFKKQEGNWTQVQKLVASDRNNEDYFGKSVSISGDYAVIGAYAEDENITGGDSKSSSGSVYIFKNTNGVWSETQKIVASDRSVNDYFGYSVSISGDYIIVGAYSEDENITGGDSKFSSGSVYIFKNTNGIWSETQKLVASDRDEYDNFGEIVDINGDYAIVSAMQEDENSSGANTKEGAGSVYVFKNTNGIWSETQKLVSSDRDSDDRFGSSLFIDENYIAVGAQYEDHNVSGGDFKNASGSVYIFKNINGTWIEDQKVISIDRQVAEEFGVSVSIDGEYMFVGAVGMGIHTKGEYDVGGGYIFQHQNGSWKQIYRLMPKDRVSYYRMGKAVDISGRDLLISRAGTSEVFTYTIPKISNHSIDENEKFVIDINVSDVDILDTIAYSLSGNDSNKFDINSSSGIVSFINKPDYENPNDTNSDNIYDIVITATDLNGSSDSISLFIEVIDKNITSSDISINMDENTNHTFSINDLNISGEELNSLIITSLPSKGSLKLNNTNVFENQEINSSSISDLVYSTLKNEYGTPYTTFKFIVNDGDLNSSEYTATININNINDKPVIESTPIITINEDSEYKYILSASDIDSKNLSWRKDSSNSWLNLRFEVDSFIENNTSNIFNMDFGSTLPVPAFVDIDNDGDKDMFIAKADGKIDYYKNIGTSKQANFIKQDDSNNPLNITKDKDPFVSFVDIDNDGDKDVFIGTYYNYKTDQSKIYFYRNIGTKQNPNFQEDESNNPFTNPLTVAGRLTPIFVDIDNDGDNDVLAGGYVSSQVHFKNEGNSTNPQFIVQSSANSILEDIKGLYASDVRNSIAVSDLDQDGDFDIYLGNGSGKIRYAKNIGISENPVFNMANTNSELLVLKAENIVPIFADLNGDGKDELIISTDTQGIKYYDINGSYYLQGTPTNDEVGIHDINLTLSDGESNVNHNFTITVNNTNDTPTITSNSSVNLIENNTVATTLTVSDADTNDTKTYSIIGGSDSFLFDINSSSGVVRFKNAPNYESPNDNGSDNIYEVIVKVVDAGGLSDTQTLNVSVLNNISESPSVSLSVNNTIVAENKGISIISATLSEIVNEDTNITIGLKSGSNASVSDFNLSTTTIKIDGNTTTASAIFTSINDIIDEVNETAVIEIINVNGGENASENGRAEVNITIIDDDTSGIDISKTVVSVDENGTTDSFTIKLDSQPTSNVVIDINNGDTSEVTVSPSSLSFTPQNYNVAQTVIITGVDDSLTDGNIDTNITISVNSLSGDDSFKSLLNQIVTVTTNDDDNFLPVITQGDSITVNISEDSNPKPFNLTLDASDKDKEILTWSIDTNASNGIASVSGIGTSKNISYSPNNNYNGNDSFVVKVEDTKNGIDTIRVNVIVTPINDVPVINTNFSNITLLEDNGTTSYDVNISDIDGDDLNLSIESNNTDILKVSPNWTGLLKDMDYKGVRLDFNLTTQSDANGVVRITLNLSDDKLSTSKIFDVNVSAQNDAPRSNDINITINEDTNKTFKLSDFTFNDIDIDDGLEMIIISSLPSKGNLTLNSTNISLDQNIYINEISKLVFTPEPNKSGSPYTSFGFRVNDGDDNSSEYIATINVNENNDAPILNSLPSTINKDEDFEDFNITLSSSDLENDSVVYSADINDSSIAKLSVNNNILTISSMQNRYGKVSINVKVSQTNDATLFDTKKITLNISDIVDVPVSSKSNGYDINTTTKSGNIINIDISNLSATVTTDKLGTVTTKTTGSFPIVGIVTSANGDTNTSIKSISYVSNVQLGDVNKTISLNEKGEVSTKIVELNTTIVQKDRNLDIVKISKNVKKDINVSISVIDVRLDENKTIVLSSDTTNSDSKDINISVRIKADGELSNKVGGNNGATNLKISKDINSSISIDEEGLVKTQYSKNSSEISIFQNNMPSIDINSTKLNISSKLANVNVNIDDKAEIELTHISQNKTTMIKTSHSDTNLSFMISGGIKTSILNPINENNTTISYTKDGLRVDSKKADHTLTSSSIDTNGKLNIKTKNSDGELTSLSKYPVGTLISNNENNTSIKYKVLNTLLDVVLDNEGSVVISLSNDANTTKVNLAQNSILDISSNGTVSITEQQGKKVVININGTVDVIVDNNTTTYSNYPDVKIKEDGEILINNITVVQSSSTANLDTDGDGIIDLNDKDDDNDGISDFDEGNGNIDTDNDGIANSKDIDSDNDGILDSVENSANNTDVDGDTILNYLDSDSDGDGKADKIEGIKDDDLDGIVNYLDSNDNGSDTPIDNGNGTQTSTFKKLSGGGDSKTTSITLPNGKSTSTKQDGNNTIISITDAKPNVDINISSLGSLNIDMNETNGTHNINIVNPGADINISNDGNLSISIPSIKNSNSTICDYKLDVAYDGSDMITYHYLNQGLANEVITTIIMKIPNANIEITKDNKIKHLGSFINANSKDVNVTGIVNCDGSISTVTKIADINGTFVSVNKAGSKVVIDTNGNVDTTTPLELNISKPTTLQGVNFKIDSNSGDINATKVYKDTTTNQVTFSEAQIFLAGTKLTTSGAKVQEVNIDLSNTRKVQVNVTDTNDNNLSSITLIDNSILDGNITQIDSGEDGAITTQVNTGSSIIQINNYLDGKAKHEVTVNGTTTQATSNLEGADVNVTSSGVTTTYEDTNTNIMAKVEADTSGHAIHQMIVNGITTKAVSEIIGASTTIDQDSSGNTKVVTTVSVTNENNQSLAIEIDALSDGSAIHKVEVNGQTTQASVALAGAQTTIDANGTVETNSSINNNTSALITAKSDGTASHKITGDGFESTATSEIIGATTTVSSSGTIQTEVEDKTTQCNVGSEYVKAYAITNSDGTATTKFIKYDCSDNYIQEIPTISTSNSYPKDNNVTISQNNGLVIIQTNIKLTSDNNITF